MAKTNKVIIRVPASTANLGPGFDCLAIALDIWNEIEFSISGNSLQIEIEGEGQDSLPRDKSNLIYQSLQKLAEAAGVELPKGIKIHCANNIPESSGLGSSSSALIAGLLGGRVILDLSISDTDLLKIALDIEGHADNISACLYGGLTISVIQGKKLSVQKIEIQPLKAIIALPDVHMPTSEARAILPENVPLSFAIFNISRTALLVQAFSTGNYSLLESGMHDKLHQPFRLPLIAGAESAIDAAMQAGALSSAMSGAGPSVIAFFQGDKDKIRDAMNQAFLASNQQVRTFCTSTINIGSQVFHSGS